ncbi:MAG TPA: hypothetical protein VK797_26200 [Tepidisphaeraceae bacterium]|nr:hypothetical protein [Tepidisphaeraceae bacterium]
MRGTGRSAGLGRRPSGKKIADVVDPNHHVLGQIVGGRDGDHAFIDRIAKPGLAASNAVEDDVQRFGELDVSQAGADRRVAVDAGALKALPVDENIGPGNAAQRVDHVAQPGGFKLNRWEGAVQLCDCFDARHIIFLFAAVDR